jgi:hypothetical protein
VSSLYFLLKNTTKNDGKKKPKRSNEQKEKKKNPAENRRWIFFFDLFSNGKDGMPLAPRIPIPLPCPLLPTFRLPNTPLMMPGLVSQM